MGIRALRYDVLVIGAGIAGSASAMAFARQGRQVLLVERSLQEPDRIVGELLQPGGVDALSKLGLAQCLEGIDAFAVKGYHLYWRGEITSFWFCPETAGRSQKPEGRTFHHGKFVNKLREAAMAQPNLTVLEATAVEILRDEGSGAVIGAICSRGGNQPEKYHASLTILADGSTSNFRSQFTPCRPRDNSRFWGLELIDAHLPSPGYAYGVLGSSPAVLMYQIGTRETRILIDIPHRLHRELGSSRAVRSYISRCVLPSVPESVQPGLERAILNGRLRSMPSSWMPSTRVSTPGIILLGDASNMRHPLTGAGMTVVLKDVVLLTSLLQPAEVPSLGDSDTILKKMRVFHWRRKAYSASLNILAQALYFLFASEDHGLEVMLHGFMQYIQEGEKNFAEPAGIMGGTIENPLRLFYHFFAIAFYSIGIQLRQAGLLGLPGALLRSSVVIASAIGIIWGPVLDELWPH